MNEHKLVNHIKIPLIELCINADKIVLTPINSPRTTSTDKLKNFIFDPSNTKQISGINHVNYAEEALEICSSDFRKTIIIAGSFYLAGEVLKTLKYEDSS